MTPSTRLGTWRAVALLTSCLLSVTPLTAQDGDPPQESSAESSELQAAIKLLELQKAAFGAHTAKLQAQQAMLRMFFPSADAVETPEGTRTVAEQSGPLTVGSQLILYETLDQYADQLIEELVTQDPAARELVVYDDGLIDGVNLYNTSLAELTRVLAGLRGVSANEEAAAFVPLLPEMIKGTLSSIGEIQRFFRKDVDIRTTDLALETNTLLAAMRQAVLREGAPEAASALEFYHPRQQAFLVDPASPLMQVLRQVMVEEGRVRELVESRGGFDQFPGSRELVEQSRTVTARVEALSEQLLQSEALADLLNRDSSRILHLRVSRAAVQDRTVTTFFKGSRIDAMTALFGEFASYDRTSRLRTAGVIVTSTQSATEPVGRRKGRR